MIRFSGAIQRVNSIICLNKKSFSIYVTKIAFESEPFPLLTLKWSKLLDVGIEKTV